MVDPIGKKSWHKSLESSNASGLTRDQVDSLSSVNCQFHQDGATLLIVGGITILERDPASGDFIRDDQAPFTNQCSLVVRDVTGKFRQYWLPARFPLLQSNGRELRFGTNAEFYPSAQIPQLAHKVLDLAIVTREVVIGHIFGGIVADAGNHGDTGASGRVFEVRLNPLSRAPVLVLDDQTLSWKPGLPGSIYLLEDSADLQTWQEKENGLDHLPEVTAGKGRDCGN
ncbi:hypothetical protein N9Z79_06050 [Akkermansiaceae bacterium]|nr:hypothetical protein [Akkermansiaceae bacterium]